MLPTPTDAALAALNRLLGERDWATARLRPFAGRALRLTAGPVAVDWKVAADGTFIRSTDVPVDVTIQASPASALVALARGDDLLGAIHVQGAGEFAEALSFVFRNIRPDFEEILSGVTGDVVAVRVVRALGGQVDDTRAALMRERAARSLTTGFDLAVRKTAGAAFAEALENTRDGCARLEKRIARLESHAGNPSSSA